MTKILDFAPITSLAAADALVAVDVSNASMDASGTTVYIEGADVFGATTPVPYNLNFASGQGIQFNSGDVFTGFDDGTWTPSLEDGSGNAFSTTTAVGSYTKVGPVVLFNGLMSGNGVANSASGQVYIENLPFTVNNTAAAQSAVSFGGLARIDFDGQLGGYTEPNTTRLILSRDTSGTGNGFEALVDTDVSDSFLMRFSGHYVAA